jgi:hypothetical protein
VDVDTIEQRTRYLAEIALDDGGRAAAFARGIAEKSAEAPVQIATARDLNGEGRRRNAPLALQSTVLCRAVLFLPPLFTTEEASLRQL